MEYSYSCFLWTFWASLYGGTFNPWFPILSVAVKYIKRRHGVALIYCGDSFHDCAELLRILERRWRSNRKPSLKQDEALFAGSKCSVKSHAQSPVWIGVLIWQQRWRKWRKDRSWKNWKFRRRQTVGDPGRPVFASGFARINRRDLKPRNCPKDEN